MPTIVSDTVFSSQAANCEAGKAGEVEVQVEKHVARLTVKRTHLLTYRAVIS
jgi:hypothetical protein